MTNAKLLGSFFGLLTLMAAGAASAQEAELGAAVDGRVEGRVDGGSAAAPAAAADPGADHEDDEDDAGTSRRMPRSRRTQDRIRGGAGVGVLGAFDDGGSGMLLAVEGRFGAQLNAWFGVYGQLTLAGGEMDQRDGTDTRSVYATFAVIPELHVVDELAIGLGPIVMAGQRDVDQVGSRYVDYDDDPFDRFDERRDRDDESVARAGLMLRVSPAITKLRPSGRIHAFRPSFEVAVLGTTRDVVAPEQPIMVLAGVSLNWDTW